MPSLCVWCSGVVERDALRCRHCGTGFQGQKVVRPVTATVDLELVWSPAGDEFPGESIAFRFELD